MPLKITSGKTPQPPRILLYGPGGVGKSTLASHLSSPVFLPVESGLDSLAVDQLDQPTSFDSALAAVAQLWTEEHQYRTLVIDSITALEKLIWAHVCAIPDAKGNTAKSIEDFGFGKGYVAAAEQWNRLLMGLDYLRKQRGMSIVLIGHSEIKSFASPTSEAYDRYQPRLHKTAAAQICEWSDAVLFANFRATINDVGPGKTERFIAVGSGERILYCDEKPSHIGKNRYSLPATMKMDAQILLIGIAKAFDR